VKTGKFSIGFSIHGLPAMSVRATIVAGVVDFYSQQNVVVVVGW
jgi:hypothetical protein